MASLRVSQGLSLFFLVLAFPNCQDQTKEANTAGPQKHIRISLPSEPPTLDWNLATDNVSYQILNQLMEGLTQFDEKLNVVPAAASSWEVKDGGKTFLFHLDTNYRWSDGVPLTARHFRDSWIRLLKPETAAEYAYFLFDIVGARDFNSGKLRDETEVGIEVVNDRTLKVKLSQPIVFFPAITTFMVTFPIRKDLIERNPDRWTEPPHLVTCGPYLLTEWRHEYRLRLEKNLLYGGEPKPAIDGITIFLVSEPSTALSLYEAGELDLVSPPPIALPKFRNRPDLIHAPKLRGYYFGFNIRKKPFDDRRVRQALAMALNKKEIPNILKGGERATDSWIPPGMVGFNEAVGLKFDPERAKQILSSPSPFDRLRAGSLPWFDNPSASSGRRLTTASPLKGEGVSMLPSPLRNKQGNFCQWQKANCALFPDARSATELAEGQGEGDSGITLMFNSDPVNKKIAEWAASQWKKHLGIDVALDNQEWKSYLALLRDDPPPLFRLGWGADFPDPDNFMNLFTSYSGNNHTGWKEGSFDALIARGAAEPDQSKRQAIYNEAQKLLLEEEAVIIPLFVATQNILVSEKLRPFPLLPMDFVYYKRVP